MQKKKARKGFLFLCENLCCRLVGRGPCAPPRQMRCSEAGHMGPALQGAAVIRGGQSRPPLRTLSLRASPQTGAAIRRLARQSVFPALAPLDKPVGMGIIINTRGRCIRRSAPAYYGNLVGLMTRKNRHLAEWRFLLFSRWTRIEIECPRI